MTTKDLGGPAFPVHPEMASALGCMNSMTDCGMTLRDYFAAKAMQSLVNQSHEDLCEWLGEDPSEGYEGNTINVLVTVSYEMADAMLKARND
jgi:hypothetical protein